MSIVQKNLIRIIEEKGLLKKGVAKRANMTPQVLSDVLAGRRVIRADMVPSLANALEVGVAELFRDDEKTA
jgi:transcriptional regulator with XRE-family HTH domain